MTLDGPEQLNARHELFTDPQRPETENRGPFLLIIDNFYSEPETIRIMALSQEFFQYSPPLPEQVGERVASRYTDADPRWFSTSLLKFQGRSVNRPHPGFRYADQDVAARLAEVTAEQPDPETWVRSGDGWNGAFHLHYASEPGNNFSVHHHYRQGDVYPRGWSGVVYLSPDAPDEAGTSIWQDKVSGKCIAQQGAIFSKDMTRFKKMLSIANRFNRLVLFRENILHRAESGFGDNPQTGRLTQTFFFLTR